MESQLLSWFQTPLTPMYLADGDWSVEEWRRLLEESRGIMIRLNPERITPLPLGVNSGEKFYPIEDEL